MVKGTVIKTLVVLAGITLAGMLVLTATVNAAPAVTQQPYFRSTCDFVKRTTADPTNPANDHMHDIFGNKELTDYSRPDNMLHDPSSCNRITQDSAIWATSMQFRWGDRAEMIEPVDMGVYYRTGARLDQFKTIPVRFGSVFKAGESEGLRGDVKWQCGWDNGTSKEREAPPNRCANGELGMTISFGECWDGVDRGMSIWNVVEPREKNDGSRACPQSHPRQIPELEVFVDYKLPTTAAGTIHVAHNDGWEPSSGYHMNYVNAENTEDGYPEITSDDGLDLTKDCINERRDTNKPRKCAARG